MPKVRRTAVIVRCAGLALAFALAPTLHAQEPGATKGAPAAPVPTPAEVAGSPDWPCMQRKVDTISPAQVWDGPPIDDLKGWENDDKIQDLTRILESRRVSLEDAEKALKEYAQAQPEGERDQKLTLLFASVFAKINGDRKFVVNRIEEFQKRQKARAAELEREGKALGEKSQPIPSPDSPGAGAADYKLTPEQETYNWNARIFQDRQQNLSVACDIPGLIEARAFDIAKLIRAQMKS
jgi:DNA-binding transcriptional MerR regulator